MAKEITFVQGLYCKKKEFANGGSLTEIDFNMEEFLAFANQYAVNGQLNLSLQTSKGGKLYAKVNDFRRDYAIQQASQQAPQQPAYQAPQQTQSQPAYQAPTGNPHQPTQAQEAELPAYEDIEDGLDDCPF